MKLREMKSSDINFNPSDGCSFLRSRQYKEVSIGGDL
jgi:hypothetical protein